MDFIFLCKNEEDSKSTVCRKANCNLSGNGCKMRGRVGGVAAERIRPSYHTKTMVRGRVDFIFLCVRGDSKSAVCRMANCNLSGNGCKVRGRVGGVAAERIRPIYHIKTIVRGRVDFIFLCVREDSKSTVCRLLLSALGAIILTSPFKERFYEKGFLRYIFGILTIVWRVCYFCRRILCL